MAEIDTSQAYGPVQGRGSLDDDEEVAPPTEDEWGIEGDEPGEEAAGPPSPA